MVNKKTRDEIKQRILSSLEFTPLSIKQLSNKVESNWSTINECLEELKSEGYVKEIVSTEKLKIYLKVTGDTYYNLPITQDQRNLYRFLFSLAISEYKEQKKRIPKKTELAKIVVDTVNEAKLDLPTVWYLYGQIPVMIADPTRDYSTAFIPNEIDKIKKILFEIVKKQNHENTHKLKLDHYQKYSNSLYEIKENLLFELGESRNKDRIIELLNLFYVGCPNEYPDVFNYVERLYSVSNKLVLEDALIKNKVKVIIALDSVWGIIATYKLIDSLSHYPLYSNKEEIVHYYLGQTLETKKNVAEEALVVLESIYLNILTPKELEISEESIPARQIMVDWTGE